MTRNGVKKVMNKRGLSSVEGKAQTVLGPVETQNLGVTLCHEHLLVNFPFFVEPPAASDRFRAYQPISSNMKLEYLGWIKYNWLNNLDNWRFNDENLSIDEVLLYKQVGGNTIVEVTPIEVGRDPLGLARIARATGVNIIMGTAYYVSTEHPSEVDTMTEDDICERFVSDITEGILDVTTKVRAGIIGEIGCSWPWGRNEKKVLRAAVKAQRQTGAPLSIHPGRSVDAMWEAIEIVREARGDLSHTIVCHVDRTIFDSETRCKVCEAGVFLEWDLFSPDSNCGMENIDFPNDYQRINQIIELISKGYVNHILLSHDNCMKTQCVRYGGLGYGHILNNVVPIMRRKGISEEDIRAMLVENPKRVLAFVSPEK